MTHQASQLVEHFFRHESANLIAVLTRAFGFSRIDLVEDMVQAAMVEALRAWKLRGVPDNPAGWIHRVAKNRIVDTLRRDRVHTRALAESRPEETEVKPEAVLFPDEISDSLLRMMFACCHPSLDRQSQIALTLKILCGFGDGEIARGLLISREAAKKRVFRAKRALAEQGVDLEHPAPESLPERLAAVHNVLYLMFNEGYSTSRGDAPIREDLCEEAARLCHLLCENPQLSSGATCALLALMLFHAARLESRMDQDGAVVLLENQDRSLWDRGLIRQAETWLARSAEGPVSPLHLEAGIAMHHCRAVSVRETNWAAIATLYEHLLTIRFSPLYVLNRAVALGQTGETTAALNELQTIRDHPRMQGYSLLECAFGQLRQQSGDYDEARAHFRAAREQATSSHERRLIDRKISDCHP